MKKILILATMLLMFAFANAQSKIYTASYGSKDKCVGIYEGGKIYTAYYGSKDKCIGIYEGPDSGAAAAAFILLL